MGGATTRPLVTIRKVKGHWVQCAEGLAAQSGEHCNCIRGFCVSLWKLKAGVFSASSNAQKSRFLKVCRFACLTKPIHQVAHIPEDVHRFDDLQHPRNFAFFHGHRIGISLAAPPCT